MKKALRILATAIAAVMMFAGFSQVLGSGGPGGRGNRVERLEGRGAHGRISVRSRGAGMPRGASVSISRTSSGDARRKVEEGLGPRKSARRGAAALGKSARKGTAGSARVLAMYDISISDGGRKWQPAKDDPVRVEVNLDEAVAVGPDASLVVVHTSDDGTVEQLPESRFGFSFNDSRTAVTAFWFDADGFSVYSIVDTSGNVVTPRRFYHFYGHPENIDGSNAVKALPYLYYDTSNDVVNVQIAKDGDSIKEPPVPPDIFDDDGVLSSMFEGWYIVGMNARPADAVESKLDPTNKYFQFVWPVGVTNQRLSFTNAVSVAETEDTDYWVVPLYEHARFLQFNENSEEEQEGGSRIIDRKLVAINDETGWVNIKVSDVSAALVNGKQEYFCGWRYLDKDNQYKDLLVYSTDGQPQDQYIKVDNALFQANGGTVIPLYPIYVSAHFLNFDTNAKGSGATYVGSIFVRSTSEFSSVTPSGNRPGYNFVGWSVGTIENGKVKLGERVTDAAGNFIPNKTVPNETGAVVFYTDAAGNVRLNKDVTLYATWEANTSASYRVIVWQQRVTDSKDAADADKKYFYVTHYTGPTVPATTHIAESMITGFTGTRADGASISSKNLEALSGVAADNAANEDFTGFHYSRFACEDEMVAPDGSTVINVYYDRDLITFRFCHYNSNQSHTVYFLDSDKFTGTRYVYSSTWWSSGYSQTTSGYSREPVQYRKDGDSYKLLYYSNGSWYTKPTYSNPPEGAGYVQDTSHWIPDAAKTMTGLYGQTLSANGYTWPSENKWHDGYSDDTATGTQSTFLDGFLPTTGGDETFFSSEATSQTGATIVFYKEGLDGAWVEANRVRTGASGNSSFYISDKYNGFTAHEYSLGSGWTSVGTYANGYYGSPVSVSSTQTLSIRFKRKQYELIYKDGDNTVCDTGKNVPYESSLAGYDYAVTDAVLEWGSRDTSVGEFEGWYEDASLTVRFDFTATMPDGKKFLYAKWAPIKYRVIVDPNGGEMQSGDSTWFYLDAGEKLVEYPVTRNYRLDMHNGMFYYHHDLWDPVKDKHTDQYDPSTSSALRRAYYTQDISQATTNEVSDPGNLFSYEPKAYAFMGWYEVLEDGTLAVDPFNFSDPPNRPITIRAIWRRTGIYTLRYESVDPDGLLPNEVFRDPEAGVDGGYIDDAATTLAKAPTNYNRDDWVWEGWQVVDTYNNNIPLTGVRSPGDAYIVHEAHADRQNVIHFRAVYKYIGDGTSKHIPEVTDLVLDSNDGARLVANAALPQHEGRTGIFTYGTASSVGGINQGVWFAGQQNNFSVNLADYSAMFEHSNGFFLLGWDPLRRVDSLIPTYSATQTIGADKSSGSENALYAVWEPQIYVEFVNDTGDNLTGVQLYIPSWVNGELFRVNNVTGTYGRETFEAFSDGMATFNLAANETLRLVLPDAADRDFTVNGTSGYAEGTKLIVTRTEPQVDGQEAIPDASQSVYPGEQYMVAGTMKVSPTPVQVRFTKTTYATTTNVPVRYFLHNPNGTVAEITNDSGSWRSFSSVKKTLEGIGAGANDIAALLRKSSTESVHEYLAESIHDEYAYTTIGVGAATGDFYEWRSITKCEPSGGSYIRFSRESLEWSRYSQVWNTYTDAAVYVVFYRRIPVHVTVAKNVVGTETDKMAQFGFAAAFEEHVSNVVYEISTTFQQTRTVTYTGRSEPADWDRVARTSAAAWGNPRQNGSSTTNSLPASAAGDVDINAFSARADEEFSLAHGERHPITIYYEHTPEQEIGTSVTSGIASWSGNATYTGRGNSRVWSRTQVTNYTQKVRFVDTYQYETAVIQEAETNQFTLTGITADSGNQLSSHTGTGNLAARTYTIASKRSNSLDYTPLDTAVFTNTRKTGAVTVTKTAVNGEEGDTFPFIVTLGETVVGKDSYTPPAGVHLGPYGKVFTFTLANGGSMTLPGLPAGASYTVEEGSHEKYIATVPANAAGTVEAGATTVVAFTNTHKVELGIVMKDLSVIFTGEEQHGHEVSAVSGTGSTIDTDAYTVTGLKSGHVLTVEHYVMPHGTAVGSYTGHVENVRFTVRDSEEADVTGEYTISMTPGALTIEPTPIVVTVTGNHETKTYNGEVQECLGYTYVITHATSHEVISNDNVYVAVPPDYQSAKQKDVGRRDMHLSPSHVIVTVPDGMSVTEVVVAANGYLEITPRPVTVKADDKVKVRGCSDPVLTATVSGTVGDDVVAYSLSRAAGEDLGQYAITASGDESQGNYSVTFVPGTLTIDQSSLIQRVNGELVPVSVSLDSALLSSLGFDASSGYDLESVQSALNAVDPNGLRRWENAVTGTAPQQPLLSTKVASGDTALVFDRVAPQATAIDLGYIELRDVRKRNGSSWERVAGPVLVSKGSSAGTSIRVDLPNGNGTGSNATGLYRVTTLLVPEDNLSITNELPSTNIIGVVDIASPTTNMLVSVPWKELASLPGQAMDISIDSLVSSSALTVGDRMYDFNQANSEYDSWMMESQGGQAEWTAMSTVVAEDSFSTLSMPESASEHKKSRGGGFMLLRNAPAGVDGTPKRVLLVGQYDPSGVEVSVVGGTEASPGFTIVGNPGLTPLKINDIGWNGNPTASDVISIPSDGEVPLALTWSNGAWGYWKSSYNAKRHRVESVFVTDVEIPAGRAFWYARRGAAFTIRWASDASQGE